MAGRTKSHLSPTSNNLENLVYQMYMSDVMLLGGGEGCILPPHPQGLVFPTAIQLLQVWLLYPLEPLSGRSFKIGCPVHNHMYELNFQDCWGSLGEESEEAPWV